MTDVYQTPTNCTMSHLDDATHVTNPSVSTKIQFQSMRLLRRSPRAKLKNNPDIDFDEASRAWYANKIRRGPMIYYRCVALQQNGYQCTRAVTAQKPSMLPICKMHTKKNKKIVKPDILTYNSVLAF